MLNVSKTVNLGQFLHGGIIEILSSSCHSFELFSRRMYEERFQNKYSTL